MTRFVCLTSLPLLFSLLGVAQQPPVSKDPNAIAIIQQSLSAMGGGQNFTDVQATGTTTLYGDTGNQSYPITLMATGRTNIRTTVQHENGPRVYVTDGTTACVDGAMAQNISDMQFDMYARRIDFVPVLSLLREYGADNMQVQYAGSATVGSSTVDVVALSFMPTAAPPGFNGYAATQRLFYIDRATLLVTKMQFVTVIDSGAVQGPTTEIYFSQYQMIGGFAVPMLQSTYADGRLAQDLALDSASFNSGLDASNFAMNCGVTSAN